MFKYKSPLSRLLEGAGKPKEETAAEPEAVQDEKPEPIADFNALRAALGGGSMATESYEDTDELIPEDSMPNFENEQPAEVQASQTAEEEVAASEAAEDDDQIVTLHQTVEETVEMVEENVLASVAEEVATPEPEEIAEVPAEPEIVAEPEPAPVTETLEPTPVEDTPEPVAAPAPAEDRRSRVKTTFLGFERADTHVQDLMETAEPVAKAEAAQQTYPVGWLVVTSGPGRGACITLTEGLMQIGRNDDQAIQLDFGDTGISRSNHAVIAYDPEDRKCYLGHGGKANLVRLNGKPVLSTLALSSGDLIRISETSIRFTAFCDDGFDWRDAD